MKHVKRTHTHALSRFLCPLPLHSVLVKLLSLIHALSNYLLLLRLKWDEWVYPTSNDLLPP